MVRINWTDQSLDDIENIAKFIAKDSQKYARIQVQRFFDNVETLRTLPESGRIVPEIGDEKIREIIQGNYRIIYRIVTNNSIDILTVHHSSRLLSNNPGTASL
jgi:addiction module RelE/StbE family toxin